MSKPNNMRAIFQSIIFTLINFLAIFHANALDITVTAKIVMPPCVVNNGNVIDIDFGDSVIIPDIDGQNYRTTIPYTIQCDATVPNTIKLHVEGVGTSFNTDALQTSQTGLGLIFFQNGTPLSLNTPINVNRAALPTIEVAPIKQVGVKLVGGVFTAGATLKITYI